MHALDFDGISGKIKFTSEGDREPTTVRNTALNLRLAADGTTMEQIEIGEYDNGVWKIDFENIIFHSGSSEIPSQFAIPDEDSQLLPVRN